MLAYYIQPLLEGLFFVLGVYGEKFLRSICLFKKEKTYPKKVYTHDKQFRINCRISMMVVVTLLLMTFNYYTKCESQGINPSQCFYFTTEQQNLGSFFTLIFSPIIANLILFSYHLYERMFVKQNLSLQRFKETKAIFWAPILQEMLFRASFYRASQEQVSIIYLSLIFSVAHFHRFIWKKLINKKEYSIQQTLGQSVFTFVFGLYSFYFLRVYHSILSSIMLHCMCNFFGPPSFNKSNFKFHLMAFLGFGLYLTFGM